MVVVTLLLRRLVPAVLLASLLAVASPAAPALAHEADPRIATVVDEITPPLPPEVILQAQASLATQLVVRNPTATVLDVLSTDGRPFLRVSTAGVFADLETAEFFTTSNPNGAVPAGSGGGGPARWVQISAGDSWGWYDHRLHPEQLRAPADPTRPARLGEFEVPIRYGEQRSTVRGHVQFSPLLGAFSVTAEPGPQGLVVQALPGKLPGVFLSNPARLPLTVLGVSGEPFLRFSDAGVEVNENSRTHVEDRQARGAPVGIPSAEPAFRLVDRGGSSYSWLDARLSYPQDLPPEPVLRAAEPTVVGKWSVPVELTDGPDQLRGEIRWVPSAGSAEADAAARATPQRQPGESGLARGIGAAMVLLGGAVVALRYRRR